MGDTKRSPQTGGADSELSLKDVAGILSRRKLLVFCITMAGAALGGVLTLAQTPMYEASVSLLANTSPPHPPAATSVPAVVEALSFQPRGIETHRKLLEDRGLLERAADDIGAPEAPVGGSTLRVQTEPNTEFLTVMVLDSSPKRASDLANRVAERYVEETTERSRRAARTSAEYVAEQLADARTEMERTSGELRDFKVEKRVADLPSELSSYTNMLATLASGAATAEAEAQASKRMADQYRSELRREKQTVVSSTTVARNPRIAELEASLGTLEAQRAAMSAGRGPEHPEVKRLEKELADARTRLNRAVQTVVADEVHATNPVYTQLAGSLATAEATARASQARAQALQKVLEREEERMTAMPAIQSELAGLQREADTAGQMYQALSEQYHQLKVQEALIAPTIEVVSPSVPPESPSRPSMPVNLAIGLLLGILLAALIAAIAETLDDAVRTSWQAQATLGLPSLAVVPRPPAGSPLLASDGYSLEVSDAFRTLRTNLRLARPGGMPATILIASPRRGDGRSTVAVNLGVALAQSGKRVVVVDADLRNPALHRLLEAPGFAGLSDALLLEADARNLVHPTRVPGLCVLPSGPAPPRAPDLLEGSRMSAVLAEMTEAFDVVIVDSPPAPASPETLVLAGLCEAVLEVVRVGSTPMKVAEGLADKLTAAGNAPLGVVYNRVTLRRS